MNFQIQLRKQIHGNPDTSRSSLGHAERDLKTAKINNLQDLELALREMQLMEPDEIKRAIEYRKRKIDKEFDEPEGRQIQIQASQLLRQKICTIIFFLIVILIVVGAGYSHIQSLRNQKDREQKSNSQIQDMKQKIEELNLQNRQYASDYDSMKAQFRQLNLTYNEQQKKYQSLKDKIKIIDKKVKQEKLELDQEKNAIDRLEKIHGDDLQQIQKLEEDKKKKDQLLIDLQNKTKAHNSEREQLEFLNKQYLTKIQYLERKLRKDDSNLKKDLQTIKHDQKEIDNLKTNIQQQKDGYEKELNQLKKQLRSHDKIHQDKMKQLQRKIQKANDTINEFQHKVTDFEVQFQEFSIQRMDLAFSKRPNFEYYNASHAWTQSIKSQWEDIENCGGPLTKGYVNSKTAERILVPNIEEMMKQQNKKTLGFFSINKIRRSNSFSDNFFDIQILLIPPDSWSPERRKQAVNIMKKYEADKESIKCCMAGEGENFEQYLFGETRLIFYQGGNQTAQPNFPWFIFEGGISGAYMSHSGFGRFIDAFQYLSIGWWNPTKEMSMQGKGIFYTSNQLMSQGEFNGNAYNYNQATDKPFVITDLRQPNMDQKNESDDSVVKFYSQSQDKDGSTTKGYSLNANYGQFELQYGLKVMDDVKYMSLSE